jgi:hypothetical protein
MGLRWEDGSEVRLAAYVDELSSVIGLADRVGPLRDYCVGLMVQTALNIDELGIECAIG